MCRGDVFLLLFAIRRKTTRLGGSLLTQLLTPLRSLLAPFARAWLLPPRRCSFACRQASRRGASKYCRQLGSAAVIRHDSTLSYCYKSDKAQLQLARHLRSPPTSIHPAELASLVYRGIIELYGATAPKHHGVLTLLLLLSCCSSTPASLQASTPPATRLEPVSKLCHTRVVILLVGRHLFLCTVNLPPSSHSQPVRLRRLRPHHKAKAEEPRRAQRHRALAADRLRQG